MIRLFEGVRRMLTLRRRRREEQDARLRSFVTRARIESIRTRSAASSEEYRRRTAMIPTFDPVVPVAFFDPYRRDEVSVPKFEGGGGQSGGAGASASWNDTVETAKYDGVADQCVAESPTCDASPSPSE